MATRPAFSADLKVIPGYEANEDLSSYQYHAVKLNTTTGKVVKCDTLGERVLGILQDAPSASGYEATVGYDGISRAMAGGSITEFQMLVADANAHLVAQVDPDEQVVAIALSNASSGDVIPVMLCVNGPSNSAVAERALASAKLWLGNASGEAAAVDLSGDVTIANTGAVTIATGAVEDSMIEGLTSGQFIIGVDGTAANNAKVTMSGDATLSNAGVLTIATGAVEDSMIEALTSGQIIIGVDGTAANNAKVVVSGDATLSNAGVLTIATGAVEDSMIEGLTSGQFIIGVDGTAANNAKVTMSGDATLSNAGVLTIATGAVEDSMIEGLTSGQFIIGVDGTAANNAKVTMSGEGTLSNAGAFAIANDAVTEVKVADSDGTSGLGVCKHAVALWDFDTDGGAIGAITLTDAVTIPDNAVVQLINYDVLATCTSAGADAGTLVVGLATDGALSTAVAISDGSNPLDIGPHLGAVLTPIPVKSTAARLVNVTAGAQNLTGGKVAFNLQYWVSQ
jgi:hypothetical protein